MVDSFGRRSSSMAIWRKTTVDQREEMVKKVLGGLYSVSEAAARYEVSRPTVYEWVRRFEEGGRGALQDRPPVAKSCPHKTSRAIEERIVEARRRYGWGPKKLRAVLMRQDPNTCWPQPSTIGDILERSGLIESRPRRRHVKTPFRRKYEPSGAGELSTVDFKGQFRTRDGVYCYPLTMMDFTSRYLLACEALPSTAFEGVWPVYERVFREHGVPLAMQSDNGVPFAGPNSIARISRLSVKLMKLDIQPVFNEPGRPEQNGAHERMHKTLKAETTRPAAANRKEQQQRFVAFCRSYNDERPHEALEQTTPASRYQGSPRPYPRRAQDPEYDAHLEVRRVSEGGFIKFRNAKVFLGEPLAGERIALDAVDDGIWSIVFAKFEIARLDERTGELA